MEVLLSPNFRKSSDISSSNFSLYVLSFAVIYFSLNSLCMETFLVLIVSMCKSIQILCLVSYRTVNL